MGSFTRLTAVAAPLPRPNIDTDVIIRIEKVLLPRHQQGRWAFAAWRYRADGSPEPDFVLNQPRYAGAQILVAGPNFGCGSSREAAVWALMAAGIRCVVAPGFGPIFQANCFQNGMLPVVLEAPLAEDLARQLETAASPALTVDLEACELTAPDGRRHPFRIEAMRREALLQGLDPIALALRRGAAIDAFQSRDRGLRPWVYLPEVRA